MGVDFFLVFLKISIRFLIILNPYFRSLIIGTGSEILTTRIPLYRVDFILMILVRIHAIRVSNFVRHDRCICAARCERGVVSPTNIKPLHVKFMYELGFEGKKLKKK